MHWTEEGTAVARVGVELQNRGWTIYGYKPDRSDSMTDYYDPARWDGVATHPDYPGVVVGVKSRGRSRFYTEAYYEGWPTFQATPKGKAWHVEKDGHIIATGAGLNRCAGYTTGYQAGVKKLCDDIEAAAQRTARSTSPSSADAFAPVTVEQVTIEHRDDGAWIFFADKPEKAVRTRLKSLGFWWKEEAGGWHNPLVQGDCDIADGKLAWLFPPAPEAAAEPQPAGFQPHSAQEALERARFVYDHQPPQDQQDAHDYLPHWLAPHIPKLYAQDGFNDPVVFAKVFLAEGRWTFYILEYDHTAPDGMPDLMFGYLLSPLGDDCDELCYVTLEQIAELRSPTLNLPVERDLWFRPRPLSEVRAVPAYAGMAGNDPDPKPVAPDPKPVTEPPAETTEAAQADQPSPLPDHWTVDDLRFLLDRLDRGAIILVADNRLGIPTIHDIPSAEHCGCGVFKAVTPDYTVIFDAGGAMERTPSGRGYTGIQVRAGVFPYDTEGVRAKLETWLQVAEERAKRAKAEPEPRQPNFGDWVRTPDGEIVQMHGSGGMGSNRVGGYDRDGRQVGWYDRDELVFVSETMPVEPKAQVSAPSPLPLSKGTAIPAYAKTNPYLRQTTTQLNRELKRIDKELKSLNARKDYAYEIAINDHGASMDRLQREIDTVLEKRQQVVDALLAQQKPQAEAISKPPQPESFSTTLAAWLDDEHHETQRSGGAMYYIRPDGERVLWPGTTSRYEVIVRQHRCEVERAIVEGHPITGDVLNEYPDLAVQADEKGLTRPPADATYRPVWMRTRREFSVSHPMSAAGVPIGKVDGAKERYHEIVVAQAIERGYPVPERVLESYPQLRQAVVDAPAESLTPIGEWDIGWETAGDLAGTDVTCSRCRAEPQHGESWYRGWRGNPVDSNKVYLCPSCQVELNRWDEQQLQAKLAEDQARLRQVRVAQIAKWQEIVAGKPLACKHPNKVCSEAPTRIATISEGEHTVEMALCESCCDLVRRLAGRGGYRFSSRKIGPVTGTQTGSEARKPSYTDDDVAAYEGRWDVYLETGSLATVRKTVKRIDSAGVLRVASERAERGLSASTLEERRRIIQQRIRQLEKAA